MAQESNQGLKSFTCQDTMTAFRVVVMDSTTAGRINRFATASSIVIGVSADSAETGGSVPVVIYGTARVSCAASVSAGSIVGPSTDGAGQIVERSRAATAGTVKIGVALQSGSANSIIEVLLQPLNLGPVT